MIHLKRMLLLISALTITLPMAGIATADSTNTNLPAAVNPDIKYIETTGNTIPANINFDTLPACPAIPSDCPDINNTGVNANTPVNCPDLCAAIKIDTPPQSTIVVDGYTIYTDTGSSTTMYCPPAYTAVDTFKVQTDFVLMPGPSVTPITSWDALAAYQNNGYTCSGDGNNLYAPLDPYAVCSRNWYPELLTYGIGDYPTGVYNSSFPGHAVIPFLQNPEKFKITPASSTTLNYNIVSVNAYGAAAPGCGSTQLEQYNFNFQVRFQNVQCTAPLGWWPTVTQSPHATVCSRIRTEWKSLNTSPTP